MNNKTDLQVSPPLPLPLRLLIHRAQTPLQRGDVQSALVLGHGPQPARKAGVLKDGTGEEVAGCCGPHGARVGRVRERLQQAREALAGAARDGDLVGRDARASTSTSTTSTSTTTTTTTTTTLDSGSGRRVAPAQPRGQGLAQRLVARVGRVLQGGDGDGRVGQYAGGGGAEGGRGEERGRRPAAEEVDLLLGCRGPVRARSRNCSTSSVLGVAGVVRHHFWAHLAPLDAVGR